MELIGKIESINTATTSTGKNYKKITIAGKTFNIFYQRNNNALQRLEQNEFKTGDLVKATYEQTGKFPDFKNIEHTQETPTPSTQNSAKPDNNQIWEAKDRRIVRMASINAAIELLKINFVALPDEVQKAGISPVLVTGIAKQFEEWIYREQKEKGDTV